MMQYQILEVGICVVLTGEMMLIIRSRRGQLLQPLFNVVYQPIFGVIDVDGRRDVHCRNKRQSFADSTLIEGARYVIRDVDEITTLLSLERQIMCVGLQSCVFPCSDYNLADGI